MTANFVLREYPLSIIVEGEGTVSEHVISSKADYSSGTVVELTAQASDHWLFDHWEGDLNGNTNPVQITVASAKSVKAVFVPKMYDLTVEVEGEGSVSEAVLKTKSGSYQEGTTVELTANPGTGWSFDYWEGDLDGNANPNQIVVSGKKSLTAVFTKNKYAYNLKIVGPGVVDEYLIQNTKASLEYGSKVLLKAFPAEGAVFHGWGGDLSGAEKEVFVDIDAKIDVIANFTWDMRSFPLPDLLQPSESFQKIYLGTSQSAITAGSTALYVDYNRDGLVDIISVDSDWTENSRKPIRFFLASQEGSFYPDPLNDGRIIGQVHPRKQVYGDFNKDGYPDILLIGHGYDAEPWPGEYPIVLMSQGGASFKDIKYLNFVSFYHGGATGDYDNDGDLDAFLVDSGRGLSVMMINDSTGSFSFDTSLVDQSLMTSMYNAEMYDVDKDGVLDLIVGGHDHEGPFSSWEEPFMYRNMPIVFWGDGKTFNSENYTRFPKTNRWGFGLATDFDFFDIDGNGIEEVIISRTGDGRADNSIRSYRGWDIQILKREGRVFEDATSEFFSDSSIDVNDSWLVWLDIDEIDDQVYLIGSQDTTRPFFKLIDGRFYKLERKENLCYYSDSYGYYQTHLDLACAKDVYSGGTCMQASQWQDGGIWAIDYPDWVDFSNLEQNGYSLELAVKTQDPNLELAFSFETRLQTEPWYFPSYSFTVGANDFRHDGEWDLIRIPLSEFRLEEEWQDGYYWDRIKSFLIFASPYNGNDFYLDEIRIRKVLPE